MTALVWPSKSSGSTTMLDGAASPRLDEIRVYSVGMSVRRMRCFSSAHWPTTPSPSGMLSGWPGRWA